MVMAVLDQSFDVLVLRYGVQKRIYCKVIHCILSIQMVRPLHSVHLSKSRLAGTIFHLQRGQKVAYQCTATCSEQLVWPVSNSSLALKQLNYL